jgi:5-methylcytosine-specific restriction endonuclease McrA
MNGSVLVLNNNYEPLNICNLRRAMVLLWLGKAEVVRYDSGQVRTVNGSIEIPAVVRLSHFVRRPMPELKLSRRGILARDKHTCQYCSHKGSDLTLDHIVPRHKGGPTDWDNLVCCCLKCNNKKGNRTPAEAGMTLHKSPRKPRYVPYIAYPRFMAAVQVDTWREFLVHYVKDLEATN